MKPEAVKYMLFATDMDRAVAFYWEGEPIILATIADPEGNVIMLTQFACES